MDTNRLVMILEAELLNYQELIDFEEKKTQLIIESDASGLVELVGLEETLVKNLNALELKRTCFLSDWKEFLGLKTLPSLLEIAESADEETGGKIKSLRKQLLKVCEELGRRNRSNETLVKQSLEHTQTLFSIITGTNESLAYKEGGGRAELGQKVLLDKQA